MEPLRDLLERLAERGTVDDHDQPAIDLGFDTSKPTPFPILRWTTRNAAAEGDRAAAKIATLAPPSLLRVLREYGPVQVRESVIEGAIGLHWPHVPLDQVENLESYDLINGGELPWIGERRARGVVVRARWDDPQVIGCKDLSHTEEPIWLLYAPIDPNGDDNGHLMPVGSSYDDVLLIHVIGVDLVLTIGVDAFDRALDQLGRLEPELAQVVTQALDTADRIAAAFSDRADIQMRNCDADDVRSPGLDEGAARVRSRIQRMRQALAKI